MYAPHGVAVKVCAVSVRDSVPGERYRGKAEVVTRKRIGTRQSCRGPGCAEINADYLHPSASCLTGVQNKIMLACEQAALTRKRSLLHAQQKRHAMLGALLLHCSGAVLYVLLIPTSIRQMERE